MPWGMRDIAGASLGAGVSVSVLPPLSLGWACSPLENLSTLTAHLGLGVRDRRLKSRACQACLGAKGLSMHDASLPVVMLCMHPSGAILVGRAF